MNSKSVWLLFPRRKEPSLTPGPFGTNCKLFNLISTHSRFQSPSTEIAMLYRIAGSDAPLFLRELLKVAALAHPVQEHVTAQLTNRQQKALFNRLSQGIQRILGLKGQVTSLSMILTQSTVEIGVEMTKESFKQSAGGEAKTLSITECSCNGHPHEPDCMWWHVNGLPKRPWKVVQQNEGSVYIWDADNKQILCVGQTDASLPLAKGIVAMANR